MAAGNDVVAMILAGGRGTRLKALTAGIAKPAVFFGGKYRIIDFALSNVANSGIDRVGVLTQYESTVLSTYIGSGSNWGLNGNKSMVSVLPPRETDKGIAWYRGTADAIAQNLAWLDSLHPQQVLILSGDHIYRQDYTEMIELHRTRGADLTVACINVDISEASRFGIMSVDQRGFVTRFDEKPAHPESTLASMGIYVFDYQYLRAALIRDAKDPSSEHDFGKNIIPKMLAEKARICAYVYKGYWRDVGTIESLWQANMDLLDPVTEHDLIGCMPRLFSTHTHSDPQYIGPEAEVDDSLINQGAQVYGHVDRSVIFNEVVIEKDARVESSVVMPAAVIRSGVTVRYALIGLLAEVDHDIIGEPGNIAVYTGKEDR